MVMVKDSKLLLAIILASRNRDRSRSRTGDKSIEQSSYEEN